MILPVLRDHFRMIMKNLKNILFGWFIIGVAIFVINDYLYYDLPMNKSNQTFFRAYYYWMVNIYINRINIYFIL